MPLILRILASGAFALLVIALAMASATLTGALVQFFLYPGALAAVLVLRLLNDLQLIPPPAPGEGVLLDRVVATLVCSFLIWWAVVFAVLTVWNRRNRHRDLE